MEIIYVLLPISLLLALVGLAAYLWGAKSGQFDDLETPAHKILIDEQDEKEPPPQSDQKPENKI